MTTNFPTLETDAIREAVFEVRFDPSKDFIPEIFYGRMSDSEEWKSYKPVRLPIADIPDAVRRSESSLQHKPILELVSPDGGTAIRLGPDVVILSRRGEYGGWNEVFGHSIEKICQRLFSILGEIRVRRLGLRYINALRSDLHGISGPKDLQVKIDVADSSINGPFSLSFVSNAGSQVESLTRLSTTEFAGGAIPDHTTFVIDIDVRTNGDPKIKDLRGVIDWAQRARAEKNERFFSVLGSKNTERLRKKN